MTVYARYVTNSAWMGKEFGEGLARRLFGDDVISGLPRNSKGKNAGALKTQIEWIRVERGGWSEGRVENRVAKIITARIVLREFRTGKVTVLHAQGETERFKR